MEFLKALIQAKQMGLTKEEFLPIWHLEANSNESLLGHNQGSSSAHHGHSVAGIETLIPQYLEQLDQEKSNMKDELQTHLQHFQNEIQEKQGALLEEVEKKQAMLRDEFNQHFALLTKHITNTVESQTNCLKRFFTKEMELLQQDLDRKLGERGSICESEESEFSTPEASRDFSIAGDWQQSDSMGENATSGQRQEELGQNFLHREDEHDRQNAQQPISAIDFEFLAPAFHQQQQQQQKTPEAVLNESEVFHRLQAQPLVYGEQQSDTFSVQQHQQDEQHQQGQLPSQRLQHQQTLPQQNHQQDQQRRLLSSDTHDEQQSTPMTNANEAVTVKSDGSLTHWKTTDNLLLPAKSLNDLTSNLSSERCVPGTGMYAEAISFMKQSGSISKQNELRQRRPSSQQSEGSIGARMSGSVSSLPALKDIETEQQPGEYMIPVTGAFLKILNSDTFSSSGQRHLIPYHHQPSKICKVRLELWFDDSDRLRIRLHLTRYTQTEKWKWPCKLNCQGWIFNTTSKVFSKIWELKVPQCAKPNPEETLYFVPSICLQTKRGSYPDITYECLQQRGYAALNRLDFKWEFTVKK